MLTVECVFYYKYYKYDTRIDFDPDFVWNEYISFDLSVPLRPPPPSPFRKYFLFSTSHDDLMRAQIIYIPNCSRLG